MLDVFLGFGLPLSKSKNHVAHKFPENETSKIYVVVSKENLDIHHRKKISMSVITLKVLICCKCFHTCVADIWGVHDDLFALGYKLESS